ncbi:hypothetical protein [Parvularcula lutaonensis]|uniref:Uncharacterized protein n=1 Tax=Parvularcula lutaonensis TaxID=491923 RepID=A0ABV7M9P8_9PROT
MNTVLRRLAFLAMPIAASGLLGTETQLTELIRSLWNLMILPIVAFAGILAWRGEWLTAGALGVTATALFALVVPPLPRCSAPGREGRCQNRVRQHPL